MLKRRPGILVSSALTMVMSVAEPLSAAHAAAPSQRAVERFEKLSGDAQAAYVDGRFEDAIRLYLSAYDTLQDPGILFNIAYIHEKKLDNLELAEGYYERVAQHAEAPPELIDKAESRLAKVREAISARKGGPPPPEKGAPVPVPDKPPSGSAAQQAPVDDGPRLGPVVTMAAGGLAWLSGLAVGAVALGVESRLEAAESQQQVARADRLRNSGGVLAVTSDVLFFGGLLAAAGGLAWYILDAPPPGPVGTGSVSVSSGSGLHLRPLLDATGLGLALGGAL